MEKQKHEKSRKIFLRHWQPMKFYLDSYTNDICRKIEVYFAQDFKNSPQAIWCYVGAVKMLQSWQSMAGVKIHSRQWELLRGQFQFWRNQLTRDLYKWSKLD